jgi:hypothetical protein
MDEASYQFRLLIMVLAILFGAAGAAHARTWYVKHDGSGDAPTIFAANDSATVGDTVLVGPGTYEIGNPIFVKGGLVITSESGPLHTKLVPRPLYYPHYAFVCRFFSKRTEISGFWIEGFRFGGVDTGAITILDCRHLYIQRNVLVGNLEASIFVDTSFLSEGFIENNTIIGDGSGYAMEGNGAGAVQNNIIWGRGSAIAGLGPLICNCMMDLADAGSMAFLNFQADPQFCGTAERGNLFLQSDSPCAPGNSPTPEPLEDDCGLVGALPVGCSTAPVKRSTWGQIKRLYR